MKNINKKKYKNKDKKILLLVLSFGFILILLGTLGYFLSKNQLENKTEIQDIVITPSPKTNNIVSNKSVDTQIVLDKYSNIYKNADLLFEKPTQDGDQKIVWGFIESNSKLKETIYKDGSNFVPFVVKSEKSDYSINLSGFDISTVDIQKGTDRSELVKKIESFIVNLGYKKINIEDNTNLYKVINRHENNRRDIFIKNDQAFLVYYQDSDCDNIDNTGCYVRVTYSNNIEKQINSQINVLNKLVNNGSGLIFDKGALSSLVNSGYIRGFGKQLDNQYIYFDIGKYNSDGEAVLFKKNNTGSYDLVYSSEEKLDFIKFNEKIKNNPKEIMCWIISQKILEKYNIDTEIINACK